MKGRVCEVSLGRRGGSKYREGGRGMRSYGPTSAQTLGPPGMGFRIKLKYLSDITGKYIGTYSILYSIYIFIPYNEVKYHQILNSICYF